MVKSVVSGAVAILALVAFAVPASAGNKIPTKLTLKRAFVREAPNHRGKTSFFGKVKSDKKACEDGRLVTLMRRVETGEKQEVGSDNAEADGSYSVIVQLLIPGDYYTVTNVTSVGNKVCGKAKSKPIPRRLSPARRSAL